MGDQRHSKQRHISIRKDTYEKLRVRCDTDNVTMTSVVERLVADITGGPTKRRTHGPARRSRFVDLEVDPETYSMLRDRVIRQRETHEVITTPGHVLDDAINRMLDHFERFGVGAEA